MGRRCQILCCIEMVEGAHFLHNLLCYYNIAASALNSTSSNQIPHSPTSTSHSIPPPTPQSTCQTNTYQENMPHLRHRMRCRRGSGRGRATHPPSLCLSNSTPLDSSFPSTTAHYTDRYPNTHSGRGSAQMTNFRRDAEAQQPPDDSVLMMNPYHST